ncbi:MAG: energy-coupling factor transporter transmembrane protein EcfT [Anaerolineae bacterium]|nr:energy-coupling factor transporter transmembrane protein EcfT [Anaerolineae bacterium]
MNGLELHVPGDSWLHRADPRLKLGLALLGAALLFAYNNLWILILALLAVLVVLRSAAVPGSRLAEVGRLMLPIAILIPFLWPVFDQAGPLWFAVGGIRVTGWAVAQGFATAVRIVALAFVSATVVLTTDMRALLRALVRLGMPYEAALAVTIGLSYVPRIRRTYEQVTEAQMARGFDLAAGGFIRRAQARVPILVASLVSTFRSADTLARTLECRGFGLREVPRSALYEIYWRPADSALAAAALALATVALLLRFVLGLGSHPVFLL